MRHRYEQGCSVAVRKTNRSKEAQERGVQTKQSCSRLRVREAASTPPAHSTATTLGQPYPLLLSRGPFAGFECVAWESRQPWSPTCRPCLCEALWLYHRAFWKATGCGYKSNHVTGQ
jgi:hypothetical protein